jgi:hypothetical protein
MRLGRLLGCALGVLVAAAAAGCGSSPNTPASATSTARSTAAPKPAVPPTNPLQHLAESTLHTFDFSPGGGTTACAQPVVATCQAYERSGDAVIAAFLAQEKSTPMSAAVAVVDQNLHSQLVQWTMLADSLLSSFVKSAQRAGKAYLLDAANAAIEGELSDLSNSS